MVATLTTPQDALAARLTTVRSFVTIGGQPVTCLSWDAQFGTDQAVSTARLTLSLPRPATVTDNAAVACIGGHNEYTQAMFAGRIPAWEGSLEVRGATLVVRAVGWASLLNEPEQFDLIYDGPIQLDVLFDSLCARRGVPSYAADDVMDPTGAIEITLGGNSQIDEGKVIIPANQSPLTFLNNACEPFGYRVYDTPSGTVRLSRISGLPPSAAIVTFTEGDDLHSVRRGYDVTGIVNYPDIHGPTYEDAFGASVPIRAFPATVEADRRIPVNGGVRYRRTNNNLLVTQQMAEVALAVALIDGSEPHTPVTWSAIALPGVSVGDVVAVEADTVEGSGTYWLTDMDITCSDRGLTASYTGWAGAGEALPAGNNKSTIAIQTNPVHLGDETLSHYAVPVPSGTTASWTFTIPQRATAVSIRGLHHSTNSQVIGGAQTDLEVTKWELHRVGNEDAESSGNMPVSDENLARRLPYGSGTTHWSPFAVPLKGTESGEVTLKLIAGIKAKYDDFEVRDVVLEVYGIAEPVIVPAGGS